MMNVAFESNFDVGGRRCGATFYQVTRSDQDIVLKRVHSQCYWGLHIIATATHAVVAAEEGSSSIRGNYLSDESYSMFMKAEKFSDIEQEMREIALQGTPIPCLDNAL